MDGTQSSFKLPSEVSLHNVFQQVHEVNYVPNYEAVGSPLVCRVVVHVQRSGWIDALNKHNSKNQKSVMTSFKFSYMTFYIRYIKTRY